MTVSEIIEYAKKNIKPTYDFLKNEEYRCSAYLKDDTYIPCAVIKSADVNLNLALGRFEEMRKVKNDNQKNAISRRSPPDR